MPWAPVIYACIYNKTTGNSSKEKKIRRPNRTPVKIYTDLVWHPKQGVGLVPEMLLQCMPLKHLPTAAIFHTYDREINLTKKAYTYKIIRQQKKKKVLCYK